MAQQISGTFVRPLGTSGAGAAVGLSSDTLDIPSGVSSIKLWATPLDASNTIKTQRSVNNGATWVDQTTYNANQNGTSIGVTPGHQWRLTPVNLSTAGRCVDYRLSAES
jgi:hypothetical protein